MPSMYLSPSLRRPYSARKESLSSRNGNAMANQCSESVGSTSFLGLRASTSALCRAANSARQSFSRSSEYLTSASGSGVFSANPRPPPNPTPAPNPRRTTWPACTGRVASRHHGTHRFGVHRRNHTVHATASSRRGRGNTGTARTRCRSHPRNACAPHGRARGIPSRSRPDSPAPASQPSCPWASWKKRT